MSQKSVALLTFLGSFLGITFFADLDIIEIFGRNLANMVTQVFSSRNLFTELIFLP